MRTNTVYNIPRPEYGQANEFTYLVKTPVGKFKVLLDYEEVDPRVKDVWRAVFTILDSAGNSQEFITRPQLDTKRIFFLKELYKFLISRKYPSALCLYFFDTIKMIEKHS